MFTVNVKKQVYKKITLKSKSKIIFHYIVINIIEIFFYRARCYIVKAIGILVYMIIFKKNLLRHVISRVFKVPHGVRIGSSRTYVFLATRRGKRVVLSQ